MPRAVPTIARYLAQEKVSALAPTPWRMFADLLTAAPDPSKEFSLAFRRREPGDRLALQDYSPAGRSDAKAFAHTTMSRGTRELVRLGVVRRRRRQTRTGACDGPGTPYLWKFAEPGTVRVFAFADWADFVCAALWGRVA